MNRPLSLTALILIALVHAGCAAPVPSPSPEPALGAADLPRAGGCADAVLYAVNEAQDLAVVVTWPQAATRAATAGEFEGERQLPADDVSVRLQVGRQLSTLLCNDVLMEGAEVLAETEALEGTARIRIVPQGNDPLFPTGQAHLVLTNVVFEFGSGESAERWRIDRLEWQDINVGWLPG